MGLLKRITNCIKPPMAAAPTASDAAPGPDWSALPAVVLHDIFTRLPAKELANASTMCRGWQQAANDPSLWSHLRFPPCSTEPLLTHVRRVLAADAQLSRGRP